MVTSTFRAAIIAAFLCLSALVVADDPDYTCSATKGCAIGCCGPLTGGAGVCGLGPKFCGTGCTSSCDYKSECDPGWGIQWSNASTCPLNVCCSEFGFCGTTSDFCGTKGVISPSCSGRSSDARTIGYYEGWNLQRPCDTMAPEKIPLGYYTHINFAFALIDPVTFHIAPMDSNVASLYQRVTALKAKQPSLKFWIALGGWSMNDPDQSTRTAFSDLAGSETAQAAFFQSLISFMMNNGFDGVDIDWEYPAADDRSGKPEDFENYVSFLQNLRSAFSNTGRSYGISITIPSSYWYLRHFDIVRIDPLIDWFNMMTYDIHGVWDSTVLSIGSVALAHTNLTEINLAMELLWRNNINPARVNLGLGFYGRSFTMASPSCLSAGCPFSGGAKNGSCTNTAGVLSGMEIRNIIATRSDVVVTFDPVAAVKIVTWDSDQWVSYDDTQTLGLKVDYANARCLGGTMIWAVDLDDGTTIDALGANLNRPKVIPAEDPPVAGPDLGSGWGGSDEL